LHVIVLLVVRVEIVQTPEEAIDFVTPLAEVQVPAHARVCVHVKSQIARLLFAPRENSRHRLRRDGILRPITNPIKVGQMALVAKKLGPAAQLPGDLLRKLIYIK
jgi:hypothetical protein